MNSTKFITEMVKLISRLINKFDYLSDCILYQSSLTCILNIQCCKQGKVQRSHFRIFTILCIVMDTCSGCSSVLNHRRISGPRLCLRLNPQQTEHSVYYSTAAVLMQASPVHSHTLTAGTSHTIPVRRLLSLLVAVLCWGEGWEGGFQRFPCSTSIVLIKPAIIGLGVTDIWKLRCRSSLGF